VFTDKDQDQGALAVHFWDPYRRSPAAFVYPERTTGLREGDASTFEAMAHEVLEAGANADLRTWRAHPKRPGVQMAQEIGDPVQTTYEVESRGSKWPAANFVTPAWFEPGPHPVETFFDFAGQLTKPAQVGPEGYVILRERDEEGVWRTWFEDASGQRLGSRAKAASTGRGLLQQERGA
jgi:hypothetical protein